MKLSLCVVNYHHDEEITRLLKSLESFRPQFLHEVVIVDNSEQKDELKALRNTYGDWVKIHHPQGNLGLGKGSNLAVKHAQGEYVLICNPDIEFDQGSLDSLVAFAEDLGDFGVIGPQLINSDSTVQHSCRRFPKIWEPFLKRLPLASKFGRKNPYLMSDKDPNHTETVDWLVGAALLMKKDVFQEMGGFDDRFFLFFEDTDLCRRLWESDKEVWYYPKSVFVHSEERLSERGFWVFKKVFWIHFFSMLKYYVKWKGVARPKKKVVHKKMVKKL